MSDWDKFDGPLGWTVAMVAIITLYILIRWSNG